MAGINATKKSIRDLNKRVDLSLRQEIENDSFFDE